MKKERKAIALYGRCAIKGYGEKRQNTTSPKKLRTGFCPTIRVKKLMAKTVHVLPKDGQWAVKREGRKNDDRVFSTQREAIESARTMAKESSGQLVVHGRNGQIRERDTYGMPRIQDPPGRRSARIERAVGRITRDRLEADPLPPRG